MRIVVLGRGKLGRALWRRLSQSGADAVLRDSRRAVGAPWTPPVLYVLAVADAAIGEVSLRLAPSVRAKDVVLHCAGARTAEELRACADRGAATGVLHPLVSFASRRALPSFEQTTFVADGHPRAVRTARRVCRLLGATCLVAAVSGPAYHAAAALLANGSAALAHSATRILVELGLAQRDAERALAGLLTSVASNVRAVGVPGALTGPVARGDRQTVAAHVRALNALSTELAGQYQQLQPIIVACAAARPTPSGGVPKRRRTPAQRHR